MIRKVCVHAFKSLGDKGTFCEFSCTLMINGFGIYLKFVLMYFPNDLHMLKLTYLNLLNAGMVKYGGLAKLHFEEPKQGFSTVKTALSYFLLSFLNVYLFNLNFMCQKQNQIEDAIRVEYHMFEENILCSGAAFIPREGGTEEDDGWIISYVHDECNDVSQVSLFQRIHALILLAYTWYLLNLALQPSDLLAYCL